MRLLVSLFIVLCAFSCATVGAVPSLFEQVHEGVWVVRDDTGQWTRNMSLNVTHQNQAAYQAMKVLDLSDVPDAVWAQTLSVRMSVCFMVCDYSWHDDPPRKGLDEAYQIVVNGHVHEYATNSGPPVFLETEPPTMDWYDHVIPKDEFVRGRNEVIIRKAPSETNDDFLYLGIDSNERRGNSSVTFDGNTWTQEKLTIPGGNGEYMVRLYLIGRGLQVKSVWRPGEAPDLDDPDRLVEYAGFVLPSPCAPEGPVADREAAKAAHIEWSAAAIDRMEPLSVKVDATGPVEISWLDGESGAASESNAGPSVELPAGRELCPGGVEIKAVEGDVEEALRSVTIDCARSVYPLPHRIDMCPIMAEPAGRQAQREPSCLIGEKSIRLQNAGLRCRFGLGEKLKFVSLYNEYTATEMVQRADRSHLFVVDVEGERYRGNRDFRCVSVAPDGDGFRARLELDQPALTAMLSVGIEDEGLRMGLEVLNSGGEPVHFTLAFPHFAGLCASESPADDYYFYPLGGGIYADTPTLIRATYGQYQALYQVMDVYSPRRGGGLSLRIDDSEGWHKGLSLRKHVSGQATVNLEKTMPRTAPEFLCANALDEVEGTSFACEYLRRTRAPGEGFEPPPVVLAAHPGDWHVPMERYAAWAHEVWEFRPYPSRLKSIRNMMPRGWAGSLIKDGRYRTDLVDPPTPGLGRTMTDCVELMSWWEWSDRGPLGLPFDKLPDVLTEAQIKRWEPYFYKDPDTGHMYWNGQPNDYTKYNERFGGLAALRESIRVSQQQGALVTLYADPFRLDYNCDLAREKGEQWGVVGPDGEYTSAYEVWNPCHDNPEVREWIAEAMGRVMRETGADGIRLDEYGHRGYACFSTLHEHTYAEHGVLQWNKGVSEAIRLIHAELDEIRPDMVVTTEFPAYDYMMQYLEGCITYDFTTLGSSLRPLQCNIQRFYFPECKPYELDYHHSHLGLIKKFWNGAESFEQYHPLNLHIILSENEDVYQGRDFTPLIPSLARHVYINQFGGTEGHRDSGSKTLYHAYNATGHSFGGPILRVSLEPDEHIFDLLNCCEQDLSEASHGADGGRDVELSVSLLRDDIACLARLPRLLSTNPDGTIDVAGETPRGGKLSLVVCGLWGEPLASQECTRGANRLDLAGIVGDAHPTCVKLMADGTLLDAVEMSRGAAAGNGQ